MIQFKEIETKYRADNVKLTDFMSFCESLKPIEKGYYCGYDHFYAGTDDSFLRHRVGDNFNQVTFKKKTTDKNNFIRTENNITLGSKVSDEQVKGFCDSLGYTHNTSIFKVIYVYTYERFVLSFYTVCDVDLKELGRFVEIEAQEDYPWATEQEAWSEVLRLEAEAKGLGLSPQARIKKSLFEQFRRQ